MDITKIFERVKKHHSENSRNRRWDLSSFENFIVSFEKNSQASNEHNAKNFGNIIKDLVVKIQLRDSILFQNDDREKVVLEQTLDNNALKELFSKLYTLVVRAKKQKRKKIAEGKKSGKTKQTRSTNVLRGVGGRNKRISGK